jgi:hypothetical protein
MVLAAQAPPSTPKMEVPPSSPVDESSPATSPELLPEPTSPLDPALDPLLESSEPELLLPELEPELSGMVGSLAAEQ